VVTVATNSPTGPAGVAVAITDLSNNLLWSSRFNLDPSQISNGGATTITGSFGTITANGGNNGGAASYTQPGTSWEKEVAGVAGMTEVAWLASGAAAQTGTTSIFAYLVELCSIICTKLHELGHLPDDIYQADELFGKMIRETEPEVYDGYLSWAEIVVDWMNGKGPDFMFWIRDKEKRALAQQKLVTDWTVKIATPWAEHMAFAMGKRESDNRAGRILMKIGMPISRFLGKRKIKLNKNSSLVAYGLWASFAVLKVIAEIF
jgi:hypothetical protein